MSIDDDVLTGTVESTQADSVVSQSLDHDFTYHISVIYIISLIAGLLVFYMLSRRWHA